MIVLFFLQMIFLSPVLCRFRATNSNIGSNFVCRACRWWRCYTFLLCQLEASVVLVVNGFCYLNHVFHVSPEWMKQCYLKVKIFLKISSQFDSFVLYWLQKPRVHVYDLSCIYKKTQYFILSNTSNTCLWITIAIARKLGKKIITKEKTRYKKGFLKWEKNVKKLLNVFRESGNAKRLSY